MPKFNLHVINFHANLKSCGCGFLFQIKVVWLEFQDENIFMKNESLMNIIYDFALDIFK